MYGEFEIEMLAKPALCLKIPGLGTNERTFLTSKVRLRETFRAHFLHISVQNRCAKNILSFK